MNAGWRQHASLGAACVVGGCAGALLDQLHSGGLLWRTLCLTPGWPSMGQLAMRIELMPLGLAGMLLAPIIVWLSMPGQRRPSALAICLAAGLLAMAPATWACRLSSALGMDWNQSLPGMLAIESLMLIAVHAALCLTAIGIPSRPLPSPFNLDPSVVP